MAYKNILRSTTIQLEGNVFTSCTFSGLLAFDADIDLFAPLSELGAWAEKRFSSSEKSISGVLMYLKIYKQ